MVYKAGQKSLLTVLALFALLAMPSPAPASPLTTLTPQFDEAVKAYKDKKYSQSLTQLNKVHAAGLCNDSVHYYMGLCYQALNQITSAKQEYATVARGKNPALKSNALAALASLDSWSQHRSYEGNGNNFSRSGNGPARRSGASATDISFTIPTPSGGGG